VILFPSIFRTAFPTVLTFTTHRDTYSSFVFMDVTSTRLLFMPFPFWLFLTPFTARHPVLIYDFIVPSECNIVSQNRFSFEFLDPIGTGLSSGKEAPRPQLLRRGGVVAKGKELHCEHGPSYEGHT
jgi:hypothetical protein